MHFIIRSVTFISISITCTIILLLLLLLVLLLVSRLFLRGSELGLLGGAGALITTYDWVPLKGLWDI